MTAVANKHVLPVFDKPMVFYPLALLIAAGIKDVIIVHNDRDSQAFERLLGDGSHLGISIRRVSQEPSRPGIGGAIASARQLIAGHHVCVILGDNIFLGPKFPAQLSQSFGRPGATVFLRKVADPTRYGIASVDATGALTGLEEKPRVPRSNLAVTGAYVFDDQLIKMASSLTPSRRGELEIIDILRRYWIDEQLVAETIDPETYWNDAGTPDSLFDSAEKTRRVQALTGSLEGSPELAAFRAGRISWIQLDTAVAPDCDYKLSVRRVAERRSGVDRRQTLSRPRVDRRGQSDRRSVAVAAS